MGKAQAAHGGLPDPAGFARTTGIGSWPDVCECGAGAPCMCNIHGFEEGNEPDVSSIFTSVLAVKGKTVN